jgi:uncharacterized protein YdaU (DUF1376 family)
MTDQNFKRKSPAFQFYADDFLAGTMTMTNEERGAYITLLCIQWSKGSISKIDFDRVAMAMPPHSQAICQSKFELDDNGNLRNRRLEGEREKQAAYRQKQTDNAKKRWVGNATAYATALPTDMPNVCSPSPSPSSTPVDNNYSLNRGFVEPTRDEVALQAAKIGMAETEVDKFLAYYGSNGWRVGKNRMKSWPHALAGWAARSRERVVTNGQSRLFGTNTPDDSPF